MKDNPIERPTIITQEMLAEFLELKNARDEADRNYQQARDDILALKDRGARTQPGPLVLFIEDRETRRFGEANLRRHLAEAEVLRLKDLMPSSRSRSVKVFARGRAAITDLFLDELV
jgi:hypothetical protein